MTDNNSVFPLRGGGRFVTSPGSMQMTTLTLGAPFRIAVALVLAAMLWIGVFWALG